MNPNLIHPDDEDREYELNRELDAQEQAAIQARATRIAPGQTWMTKSNRVPHTVEHVETVQHGLRITMRAPNGDTYETSNGWLLAKFERFQGFDDEAIVAGRILPTHDGKPVQAHAELFPDDDPDGTENELYHIEPPTADPVGECNRCHRETWDASVIGTDDTMRQPSGFPCGGRFATTIAYENAHGPLSASLSDRTMAKVLSRPAHVPSLVMLDRDAAAQQLAARLSDLLAVPGIRNVHPTTYDFARQALADYRETMA